MASQDVAIKILRQQEDLIKIGTEPLELYMGQKIRHPNLVKVLGVYVGSDSALEGCTDVVEEDMSTYESPSPGVRRTSSSLFSDMAQDLSDGPEEIWIVMEYCNKGSLRDAIKKGEFFEDTDRQRPRILHLLFAALEVSDALEHLHSYGIIHGDLKSQNVMLSSSQILAKNFVCKVIRRLFCLTSWKGVVWCVSGWGFWHESTLNTHKDTHQHFHGWDREPHASRSSQRRHLDSSCGCLFIWDAVVGACGWRVALLRSFPFPWPSLPHSTAVGLSSGETMVSIVEGHRPKIPKYCPPMYAELIRRCWHPHREQRPTFKEITAMLKAMLGGPSPAANKGIPAMTHHTATTATSSGDVLFSEGDTVTTTDVTTADLSDTGCFSLRGMFPSANEKQSAETQRQQPEQQQPEPEHSQQQSSQARTIQEAETSDTAAAAAPYRISHSKASKSGSGQQHLCSWTCLASVVWCVVVESVNGQGTRAAAAASRSLTDSSTTQQKTHGVLSSMAGVSGCHPGV